MSNSQVKQGFGNVQDVDRSGIHPEVKRRSDEIKAIVLTEEEIKHWCEVGQAVKWHLQNTENSDFKAKPTDGKINIIK